MSAVRAERDSLQEYLEAVLTSTQRERVLLLSFNQWEIATCTVGEVAVTLHEMGTQPLVGLWANDTPAKDVGWTTSRTLARALLSPTRDERLRRALRRAGIPRESFVRPPLHPWRPAGPLPPVDKLYRTTIRALEYRGGEVGRAILQVTPDRNTPVTDEHQWPRAWVESAVTSFAWVYDQTEALIREHRATAAMVFNGRFLHDAAVAAAAGHAGLPVLAYDFGGNDTDFDLTIDDTHDWSALQGRIRDLYDRWDPQERDALGSRWFEERRTHADPRNTLFVESQTIGSGIAKPEGKRLVAYFSSSGDEISELDLEWGDYFYGQEGALAAVAEACRSLPETMLLVRTHPHKRMKPERDVRDWHKAVEAAAPEIHLDEFSDIDSYTLMRQADVVVTYGSTTGVEAGYAKRPVIVMGPSAYDELGCAVRVKTLEQLRAVLANPEPGQWQGAVAYGLMMLRRGFTYQHCRLERAKIWTLRGAKVTDSANLILKLSHWWVTRKRQALLVPRSSNGKQRGPETLKPKTSGVDV